jgi:hypothetical protein
MDRKRMVLRRIGNVSMNIWRYKSIGSWRKGSVKVDRAISSLGNLGWRFRYIRHKTPYTIGSNGRVLEGVKQALSGETGQARSMHVDLHNKLSYLNVDIRFLPSKAAVERGHSPLVLLSPHTCDKHACVIALDPSGVSEITIGRYDAEIVPGFNR